MQPDKLSEPDGKGGKKPLKEIVIPLDDDLDRYFKFLERIKLVRQREDAALAALRIYKKLNMHDWLPYVYRSGNERLIIMGQGMLHDIFTSVSEPKLYDIARITALKRKVINPIDPDLDLKEPDNWDVIFNDLANRNWGEAFGAVDRNMIDTFTVCGSPDQCTEKIATLFKTGITHFVTGSPLGPNVRESIKLFGVEVLPHFKELP